MRAGVPSGTEATSEQVVRAGPASAMAAGFTVTRTVPTVEQLAPEVTVKVYTWVMAALVVLVKVATGWATVALLSPVAGLQL